LRNSEHIVRAQRARDSLVKTEALAQSVYGESDRGQS
jgi:hypothetical protein